MLTRAFPVAIILAGAPGAAMSFELFDDLLRLAHSAPWSLDVVEAEMQALAIDPAKVEPVEHGHIPSGLEDAHYWSAGLQLNVPFGRFEAQGMLVCSRIGRDGWAVVMYQAQEPFIPFSSEAAKRVDFRGFFADDPQPFPEDAYLRLECIAVLFPLFSMPVKELEEEMEAFADRLREDYSDVSASASIFSGFYPSPIEGVVATGGSDFDGLRLDSVKAYMDPGGAINFTFSAWAILNPS